MRKNLFTCIGQRYASNHVNLRWDTTSECWESLKGISNRRVPGVGLGSNIISMCQYLAPIYTEIPFIFSFLIFVHTFSKLCFMYKVMHILLYLLLCILIFVTSWNYGTCKYILIVIVYKYSQFPIRYTVRFVNINMLMMKASQGSQSNVV